MIKTKTLTLSVVMGVAAMAPMAFAHTIVARAYAVADRGSAAAVPLTQTEQQLLITASARFPGLQKEVAGSRTQCYTHRGRSWCHTYTLGGQMLVDGLLFGAAGAGIALFVAGPYPLYWAMWIGGGAVVGAALGYHSYYSLPKNA